MKDAKARRRERPFADMGARLRALRTERGLNQEDVAAEVECSRSYLAEIENGTTAPGRDLLKRLAGFYRVGVDMLHGEPLPAALKPGSNYIIKDGTEARLLYLWSILDGEDKAVILRQIRGMTISDDTQDGTAPQPDGAGV